ncbi:hypothetical protein VNO80_33805 [Phaseolus coccineus]|uniref:Uncharacterized protein n=1 Tax=Phaseolus coccineus TaxID=3886 RepID=A0AAN9KXN4_PHACN
MARSYRVGQCHYRDAARQKVLSKRPNFVSRTGLGTLLPVFLQVNLLSFFFTESSIPYRMEEILPTTLARKRSSRSKRSGKATKKHVRPSAMGPMWELLGSSTRTTEVLKEERILTPFAKRAHSPSLLVRGIRLPIRPMCWLGMERLPNQSFSQLGSHRQPTTGICCALARLTPACLLPTVVNFKKDLSVHYGWNLTDLLGQIRVSWSLCVHPFHTSSRKKTGTPERSLAEVPGLVGKRIDDLSPMQFVPALLATGPQSPPQDRRDKGKERIELLPMRLRKILLLKDTDTDQIRILIPNRRD